MVGFYDPSIRRCVMCPADRPKCKKLIKREFWIDCTNGIKTYDEYNFCDKNIFFMDIKHHLFYASIRLKIS